jgi:hypothetical protein
MVGYVFLSDLDHHTCAYADLFFEVTDKHCIELLHKYRVVEPLISALKSAKNVQAQHAALSMLKNLSITGGENHGSFHPEKQN